MDNLTFEQLVTLLTLVGGGAAVVWRLMDKVVIPWLLKDRDDRREHQQRQQSLEQAYHLSESAVREQLVVELLSDSVGYVRDNVDKRLDRLEQNTAKLPDIAEDFRALKYEFRQMATKQQIMVGLVTEMYEDHRKRPANEPYDPT